MDANERLRGRVRKLIALGVNQKVLAGKMAVNASTLNKWLHEKTEWIPPVTAPERLAAYEAEWRALLECDKDSQQNVGRMTPAGVPFREPTAPGRHRKTAG